MVGKKKAGGLPGQFLLVVTPTKLHAFKYKAKRNGIEAEGRGCGLGPLGLKVATEPMKMTTRVTLEWPGDDGKLVCDQDGMGDNPWADDVVEALS